MTDAAQLLSKWCELLTRGRDHDTWGQFVEASEEYSRLSRQLLKQLVPEQKFFSGEQKKILGKIAACLDLRSKSLQNLQAEEISLNDIRHVSLVLENILSEEIDSRDFPIKVELSEQLKCFQTNSCLILEDDIQTDQDDQKGIIGTLLPKIQHKADCHRLTIKIVKIGLKSYRKTFTARFVKYMFQLAIDGVDITASQNTPTAKRRENKNVYFDCNVELQTVIEKLPEGAAIFFEFKHFKPKKKRVSTKCWTFMELDEIKAGPACLELYKKPANYYRKKLSLLTAKPLYLHVFLIIDDHDEK